jgi:hypothetical protein
MRELIEDGALREKFGEAGRLRARRFTAELTWPRIEHLYDVVSKKRSIHPEESTPPGSGADERTSA